jgi:hypothetical protein
MDDPLAETEAATDAIAEADSRMLSIFNEDIHGTSVDSFNTLGKLVSPEGTIDRLLHLTSTRYQRTYELKALAFSGNSIYDMGKTAKDASEIARQASAIQEAMRRTFVGEPDTNWKEKDYIAAWEKQESIASHLAFKSLTSFAEYEMVTDKRGVTMPEINQAFGSSDHAAFFTNVLRKASSSLDIGMFQFESSVMLAETMMAMRATGQAGGMVNITLSNPAAIASENALTMAVLRDFARELGHEQGANREAFMRRMNLNWFDTESSSSWKNYGKDEDTFGRIAHYKFVGANLQSASNWRNAAFAISTANWTHGALGPIARDGTYIRKMGNIELSLAANYDSIVTRGLNPQSPITTSGHADAMSELQRREDIFKEMVYSARQNTRYISGEIATLEGVGAGQKRFFMDGHNFYKEVGNILSGMSGNRVGHQLTAFVNVSTGYEATHKNGVFMRLLDNLKHVASTGADVVLLIDKLEKKNWQDNTAFKDYFKSRGESMRDLKGTGRDLEAIREILGVAGMEHFRVADTFGRHQHAKGFVYRAAIPAEDIIMMGSPNPSHAAAGDDPSLSHRETAFIATGNDLPGLRDSNELVSRQWLLNNVVNPATLANLSDTKVRAETDIWSTPLRAAAGLQAGTMKLLNQENTKLRNAGILAKFSHNVDGGHSSIASVGLEFGGRTFEDIVKFEMYHSADAGGKAGRSVYLPAFHKTISGATGYISGDAGKYVNKRHIGFEEILSSALKVTHEYIEKSVLHGELRAQAIQELSNAGHMMGERAIEARLTDILGRTSTQYKLKQRGMSFLRDMLSSFEGQELGRRAYSVKDFEHMLFEMPDNMLDLLRPTKESNSVFYNAARMSFKDSHLAHDSAAMEAGFQSTSFGYQEGRQMAKQVAAEGLKHLSMMSVSGDGDGESVTFFVPYTKMWQMSQRMKNLMGATIWDQSRILQEQMEITDHAGKKKSITKVTSTDEALFYRSMEGAAHFDPRTGQLIEDGQVGMYRTNFALELGGAVNHDIIRANTGAYDGVYQHRTQEVTTSIKMSDYDGRVIENLKQLKTNQTKLIGEKIHLGEGHVSTHLGDQKINLTLNNPSAAYADVGGFATVSDISFEHSAVDRRKQSLVVHLRTTIPTLTGSRMVNPKGVMVFETTDSFTRTIRDSYLMNTASTDAMKTYMGIDISGNQPITQMHAIINPTNIKHADMLLQHGAFMLVEAANHKANPLEMLKTLETNKKMDFFFHRLSRDFQADLDPDPKIRNARKDQYRNSSDLGRNAILDIISSGKVDTAKIERLFSEVITDIRSTSGVSGRKAANIGKAKHQAAATLAWFIHEQFHTHAQMDYMLNQADAAGEHWTTALAQEQNLSNDTALGMSYTRDKFIRAYNSGGRDSQQVEDLMRIIGQAQLYIPIVAPSAVNANVTTMSRRPVVNALTYTSLTDINKVQNVVMHGLNESQLSQLHLASMFVTGQGSIKGRQQGVSVFGTLSAAMIAARASSDSTAELYGDLAGQVRQLHQDTASKLAALEGRHLEAKASGDPLLAMNTGLGAESQAILDHVEGVISGFADPTKSTHLSTFLHRAREQQKNAPVVSVEATSKVNIRSNAFLSALERAGIGSLSIVLPQVELVNKGVGRGFAANVTGTYDIPMLDFEVLRGMSSGSGAGSEIVEQFRNVLEIQLTEFSTLQKLSQSMGQKDAFGNPVKVMVTEPEQAQLDRLQQSVQKIHTWYTDNLSNDFMSSVYGSYKAAGSTVTATTHASIPTGMLVYGKAAMRKAVKSTADVIRRAAQEEYLQIGGNLADKPGSAKAIDKIFMDSLGLGESADLLHARIGISKKGYKDKDGKFVEVHGKVLKAAELQGFKIESAVDVSKARVLSQKGVTHFLYNQRVDKNKNVLAESVSNVVDQFVKKTYGYLGETETWHLDSKGELVKRKLDTASFMDAIHSEAMGAIEARLEKTSDGWKKRVSQHDIFRSVKGILKTMALENSAHYGGRVGSPIESEWSAHLSLSAEKFGLLQAANPWLGGSTINPELAGATIFTSMFSQGPTKGDYDGDMNAYMDVAKWTQLKNEVGRAQTIRKRIQAALDAQSKNTKKLTLEQRLNFLPPSLQSENAWLKRFEDSTKQQEFEKLSKGIEDNRTFRTLIRTGEKYAGLQGSVADYESALASKDTKKQAALIKQAQGSIEQIRSLFENSADWFAEYVNEINARDKSARENGGTVFQDLSEKARREMHFDISMNVTEKAMSKLTQSMTNPLAMNRKMFRFIQEYTGVAGTEIIGKQFNITMETMNHINTMIGEADGKYRGKFFGGSSDPRQSTQVKGVAEFFSKLSQMTRDAMKPKGVKEYKDLEDLAVAHSGSGGRAAMANVTGARTVSYMHAIMNNNFMMANGRAVARDLIGDPMLDHMFKPEFVGHLDKAAPLPEFKEYRAQVYEQFKRVAAQDLSTFLTSSLWDIKTKSGGINASLEMVERSGVADTLAHYFSRSLTDSKTGIVEEKGAFAKLKALLSTPNSGDELKKRFLTYVDEAGNSKFVATENVFNVGKDGNFVDLTTSSTGGKNHVTELQAHVARAYYGKVTEWFSSDGTSDMHLLDAIRAKSIQSKDYSLALRQQASKYTHGGKLTVDSTDLNGNEFTLETKAKHMLDLAARPHTARHQLELVAALENLVDGTVIEKAGGVDAWRTNLNKMDPNGSFGNAMMDYLDQRLDGKSRQDIRRNSAVAGEIAKSVRSSSRKRQMQEYAVATADDLTSIFSGLGDDPALQEIQSKISATNNLLAQHQGLKKDGLGHMWGRIENAFSKALSPEVNVAGFKNRGSQSGHVMVGTSVGALGGGIGAAVEMHNEHQKMRYEHMGAGMAAGVLYSAPQAMAHSLLQQNHQQAMVSAATMMGAMAVGTVAENMGTALLRMPKSAALSRTLVGGVFAGVVGAIVAKPIERGVRALMGAGKKLRDRVVMDLQAGAETLADTIASYQEGLLEDVTGALQVVDQNLEDVLIGEDDGSYLSGIADEDGDEAPSSIVRGAIDQETNVVGE